MIKSQIVRISEVEIVNYLTHGHTLLKDIDPLKIAIRGTNNAGKSSVLDAICLVGYNKPWPVEDLHDDNEGKRSKEGHIKITYELADGRTQSIKRMRSASVNAIEFTFPDGKVKGYPSFRDVKIERIVQELSGFKEIALDKRKKVTLQRTEAFDNSSVFGTGISAATLKHRLAGLSNGASIDFARRSIASNLKGKRAAVAEAEFNLKGAEDTYTRVNTPELARSVKIIAKIEKTFSEIAKLERKIDTVKSLLSTRKTARQAVQSYDLRIGKFTEAIEILGIVHELAEDTELLCSVTANIQDRKIIKDRIDSIDKAIAELDEKIGEAQKQVSFDKCRKCGKMCLNEVSCSS